VIDLGEPVVLSVEVRDDTQFELLADGSYRGALANATAVTVTVTLPDLSTVGPFVPTNSATGVYKYTHTPTVPGRHGVRWVATGTNASAFTDAFDVDEATPSGIVSLADAKRHLQMRLNSTTHDEEIRTMIDAATEWVEHRIGPVVRRSITATVTPASDGRLYLDPPVISLTSLTSAYGYTESFSLASIYTDLSTGVLRYGYSGSTFSWPVTVTYVAGRAIVPAAVRLATMMMLKAFWETQRGAVSLSVQGLDEAAPMDGMGLAVWRAEKLLEPYLLAPAVA